MNCFRIPITSFSLEFINGYTLKIEFKFICFYYFPTSFIIKYTLENQKIQKIIGFKFSK
jgi:hypothetical protein